MKKQQSTFRKITKAFGIAIAVIVGAVLALYAFGGAFFLLGHFENDGQPVYYETCSLEDYGNYLGLAEEYMTNYISRFFRSEFQMISRMCIMFFADLILIHIPLRHIWNLPLIQLIHSTAMFKMRLQE